MNFIFKVAILSGIIFLVAQFLPGIRLKNYTTALIVAVVYALLNALFFWVLFIISLPAVLITFGLFVFVINAGLLWVTDKLIEDFEIKNIPTLFLAALFITIGSQIAQWLF